MATVTKQKTHTFVRTIVQTHQFVRTINNVHKMTREPPAQQGATDHGSGRSDT